MALKASAKAGKKLKARTPTPVPGIKSEKLTVDEMILALARLRSREYGA
jgi:hypothetical protein